LVLDCQDDEAIASKNWWHYPATQCYLEEYVSGDKHQLWVWDDWTYELTNVMTGFKLAVGSGNLVLADFKNVNWNIVDPKFPRIP
jgi:hypothetical protein